MKTKYRSVILAFVLSIPFWASAQTQAAPRQPTFVENLFATLLPIVLIGAFIWFFFIRQMKGVRTRIEAAQQHNERVEKLLERIAIAVEKKDKSTSINPPPLP